MKKVILSSKEAELLRNYFRCSGSSLTAFACGSEQTALAVSTLRKLGF